MSRKGGQSHLFAALCGQDTFIAMLAVLLFSGTAALLLGRSAAPQRRAPACTMMAVEGAVRDAVDAAPAAANQELLLDEWRGGASVSSWYDRGIRLPSSSATAASVAAPASAPAAPAAPPPPPITASAEASLAAALISAIAVLGIDIASVGVVENLDIAVLVGGAALSQVDSQGPVGSTLRLFGNATSFVATKLVGPVAGGVASFWGSNEVGLKARALLELGIENALYTRDPGRKEREAAEAAARAAAEAAAKRKAEKDALPFWDPNKYS